MFKFKYIISFVIIALFFIACKEPVTGPDTKVTPTDNLGMINLENPIKGQKSLFVRWESESFFSAIPSSINYTRDTIVWELVSIDDNILTIEEYRNNPIINAESSRKNRFKISLNVDIQKYYEAEITSSQTNLVFKNIREIDVDFNTNEELTFDDWRVGDLRRSLRNYSAIIRKYRIHRAEYSQLFTFVDYKNHSLLGLGGARIFDKKFGMVRSYYISSNLGLTVGYDLIREDKDEINESDDEVRFYNLRGTEWVASHAISSLGKKIDLNTNTVNNFTINFIDELRISGMSGCNIFGGSYEISKEELKINMGISTLVYCKYTEEYSNALNKSKSFIANRNRLKITTGSNEMQYIYFDLKR